MHPFFLFAAVFAPEIILFFAAPQLLARVAIVPFGAGRTVEIGPRARKALTSGDTRAASYRQLAEPAVDMGRLPDVFSEGKIHRRDASLWIHPNGRFVVLRVKTPFGSLQRPTMMGRIDLVRENHAIRMRVRFVPQPFFGFLGLLVIFAVAAAPPTTLALIAAFAALVTVSTALWNRGVVEDALDVLAERLGEDEEEEDVASRQPRPRRRLRRSAR